MPKYKNVPPKASNPILPGEKRFSSFITHEGRDYIDGAVYMARYGYDPYTLGLARSQGLPFVKISTKYYYNEADCQKWHAGG